MARVTTIPAIISRFTATPINEKKKRRVAAYARVSTDSEEQLTSYTAQWTTTPATSKAVRIGSLWSCIRTKV